MVCIVDDRDEVWNSAPNLVQVHPYQFFPETQDINAPPLPSGASENSLPGNRQAEAVLPVKPGSSEDSANNDEEKKVAVEKVEEKTEESEEKNTSGDESDAKKPVEAKKNPYEEEDLDECLLHLQDILGRIHRFYYEEYDKLVNSQEPSSSQGPSLPDLKKIVPYLKSQVLRGCRLVFSGVVPTNFPLQRSKAFHVATALGAKVDYQIVTRQESTASGVPATTHLIAGKTLSLAQSNLPLDQ